MIPADMFSSLGQIMSNPQFSALMNQAKAAQNINWDFEVLPNFADTVRFLRENKTKILPIQIIKDDMTFLVIYYERSSHV